MGLDLLLQLLRSPSWLHYPLSAQHCSPWYTLTGLVPHRRREILMLCLQEDPQVSQSPQPDLDPKRLPDRCNPPMSILEHH